MNDVTYVEASRKFAERMSEHGGSPEEWLRWGWKCATAREPEAAELEVLVAGYERRLAFYQEHPGEAAKLLEAGESPVGLSHHPATLAALTTTASVLLNLDEVVTKP